MTSLWRISNHVSLNGVGGLKYSARWNTAGRPVVYLAESPAGAMLEVLVHLEVDFEDVSDTYTLLQVERTGSEAIEDLISPPGSDWKNENARTRFLGDEWLAGARTALARVPSAIMPQTFNYMLNPLHRDAATFQITRAFEDRYDLRLLTRKTSNTTKP